MTNGWKTPEKVRGGTEGDGGLGAGGAPVLGPLISCFVAEAMDVIGRS